MYNVLQIERAPNWIVSTPYAYYAICVHDMSVRSSLQHKLKQSQVSKVRQFVSITGTDEPTATNCLSQSNWRLDLATDNFYQDPMRYFVEPPRATVEKKKLDSLFNKYRSEFTKKLRVVATNLCCMVGGRCTCVWWSQCLYI